MSGAYSVWFEDVERLKEAENDAQTDDHNVEQTDAVEWRLSIT